MSTPMFDLPEHMWVGVDEFGNGPVPEDEVADYRCWCQQGVRCKALDPLTKPAVT